VNLFDGGLGTEACGSAPAICFEPPAAGGALLMVQAVSVGTQDVLFCMRSQRAMTTPTWVDMHTSSPTRNSWPWNRQRQGMTLPLPSVTPW
jgi:hypothetical protein